MITAPPRPEIERTLPFLEATLASIQSLDPLKMSRPGAAKRAQAIFTTTRKIERLKFLLEKPAYDSP